MAEVLGSFLASLGEEPDIRPLTFKYFKEYAKSTKEWPAIGAVIP